MFKTGFVVGYFTALVTGAAVVVRLAFLPPTKWWRK